jgi:CheY-like chemotaxis protein
MRTALEDTMTDARSVPRRLLVIDDDASYRQTVGWLLRKLGHTVAEAESGSAGLALLRQQPVDLVMTDLMMPGLTGWDVARLAKAIHPHLPVLLVTGYAGAIPPDQPERRYVDALLAKPCGVTAMQMVIGALTRDRADAVGSRDPASGGLPTVGGWQTSATGRGTL